MDIVECELINTKGKMYTSLSNIAFPFPVRGVSAIWKIT